MRKEILEWVRALASAAGALLLMSLIVALAGPALGLVGG